MSVSIYVQRIACVQVQVCACTFIDDHVCLHLFIEPCVTPLTPAVLRGVLPDGTDQMTLSEAVWDKNTQGTGEQNFS